MNTGEIVAVVEVLRRSRVNEKNRVRVYNLTTMHSRLHEVKGDKDEILEIPVISEVEENNFLRGIRADGSSAVDDRLEYYSDAGLGFPSGWRKKAG